MREFEYTIKKYKNECKKRSENKISWRSSLIYLVMAWWGKEKDEAYEKRLRMKRESMWVGTEKERSWRHWVWFVGDGVSPKCKKKNESWRWMKKKKRTGIFKTKSGEGHRNNVEWSASFTFQVWKLLLD